MSETPRADEYERRTAIEAIDYGKAWNPIDFARTLERELAEANAILAALQELHGCSRGMVVHWCGYAAERSLAVRRMQNQLVAERERVRVLRGKLAKAICAMPIWDGKNADDPTASVVNSEFIQKAVDFGRGSISTQKGENGR